MFESLSKYLEEHRFYRRGENGQTVTGHDNLQDATRCLVNGISQMSTQPKPAQRHTPRIYSGSMGWVR